MSESARVLRLTRPLAFVLLLAASAAQSAWTLEEQVSTVSFVTVKNATVAEAHTFEEVTGQVSDDEGTRLEIDLASVDMGNAGYTDRVRAFLFQIADFPSAVFVSELDASSLEGIAPGASKRMQVEGTLRLHGQQQRAKAALLVSRESYDRVTLATIEPIILDAEAFGLGPGLEKLRKMAGLSSITPMVPVWLALVFVQQDYVGSLGSNHDQSAHK